MKLSVTQHGDKFNIEFTRPNESEAFLSIKACKIIQGKEGPFISMPASKSEKTGKWWNHVWADEKFQAAVLRMVGPAPKAPPKPAPRPIGSTGSGFEDMQDDVPW